jgi:hypothetical protein
MALPFQTFKIQNHARWSKVQPKFKPKSGEACPLKSFYMVKKPLAFSKRKEIPGYLRATFWVS